jgi:hypothetical protein
MTDGSRESTAGFRPPLVDPWVHAEPDVGVTYLTLARFSTRPQVGLSIVQSWRSLLRWLTWPSFAGDKGALGAWCPTALDGGRVRGGRGPVSLLVADVDDCGPGAIEHSAAALAPWAGAVIPTFSATLAKPKHRIVLLPDRPITPDEFPIAWSKMARTLASSGIEIDKGCKNPNRLYFGCVARSPEAWLGARLLTGTAIPVDAMLAAARIDEEREAAARRARPAPPAVLEQHRDRYVAGALEKAREKLISAGEGARHEVLLKEAFSLSRLAELTETQIEDALLPAFVTVAGEHRRREGERAIRDAVAARGGA